MATDGPGGAHAVELACDVGGSVGNAGRAHGVPRPDLCRTPCGCCFHVCRRTALFGGPSRILGGQHVAEAHVTAQVLVRMHLLLPGQSLLLTVGGWIPVQQSSGLPRDVHLAWTGRLLTTGEHP